MSRLDDLKGQIEENETQLVETQRNFEPEKMLADLVVATTARLMEPMETLYEKGLDKEADQILATFKALITRMQLMTEVAHDSLLDEIEIDLSQLTEKYNHAKKSAEGGAASQHHQFVEIMKSELSSIPPNSLNPRGKKKAFLDRVVHKAKNDGLPYVPQLSHQYELLSALLEETQSSAKE